MPVHAAAPVPPSPPEMTMWSALALATPAAMTLDADAHLRDELDRDARAPVGRLEVVTSCG